MFLSRLILLCFLRLRVSPHCRVLTRLFSLALVMGVLLATMTPAEGQSWTATWTQKANAPAGPRGWVDMAFDTLQGRAVLFGGTASQPLNDVWQYNTVADSWLQLEPVQSCPSDPARPTSRAGYALEYDPINQLFWSFGGIGAGCTGSPRLAGKGTTTTAIMDASLPATTVNFYKGWTVTVGNASTYVSAYDPTLKMLTLAAPLAGAHWWNPYFLYPPRGGATFSYSPATKNWGTSTGTEPATRVSPAMAYSGRNGTIVMFGGQGLSDTWALDVRAKSWRQMLSGQGVGSPPGLAELTNSMVYDSDNDVFVLFGGCLCTADVGPSSGDTWVYRLSTNAWTKMTPPVSPAARHGHNLVYDSGNKRVVLFGGFDSTSGTYFNDLWIYSFATNTWTMVFPPTSPPMRRVAAMVYDSVQQRTILYGGSGPESLTDVWSLELLPPASQASMPVLTSLSPSSAIAGSPGSTLTVTGANFTSSSVVRWNGVPRSTTFVRATQLQATIAASDLASPTTAQVSVATPASAGGGTSGSLAFAVVASPPAPSLSSISPVSAPAGGGTLTLTVTGTSFASNSVVRVNGANRATTFVSATQLTATILATDIASSGSRDITVFTPAPGGGTSSSVTFKINNPGPTLSSIAPTSLKAWGLAVALTITGSNFVSTSTAQVNGAVRPTTYVSPTQITTAIPASDLATGASSLAISVNTPAPGGGTSSVASLALTQPALSVSSTSVTPSASATATLSNPPGNVSDTLALALVGSAVTTSIQTVAVSSLPGTTSKAWAVTMPATPGQYEFRFFPNNGSVVAATSSAVTVVASANPTPLVSSLSPSSVAAGSADFALAVTGTGFVSGATVTVGGQPRTATFNSATQIIVAVQAADVGSQGSVPIQVTNPAACVGGVCGSNSVAMSVAAAAPAPPPIQRPALAFTDIVQGPKSGNTDTSQGQTSGVNGAIVTVWGFNLVGASFTINGAAPAATYYVGNATPPNCGPANLYNGYQKLQCAVLQVASTASTGAGTIVATAGGVTSNTLPFTVVSGNICFAATGGTASGACGANGTFSTPYGSIQTMLDNMDRKDIGYVRNGLNATNGVALPTPNTRFDHGTITDPFMIVAYPGAAVQIGDSTHEGFSESHSGTGYGMAYAKFTVYSGQQFEAIRLHDFSRAVGNYITGPLLNSSSGSAGLSGNGNALFVLGNEFTAVGDRTAANDLDHVVYLAGRRGVATPFLEGGREVAYNYFHQNIAVRAINIFNDSGGNNNPISDHNVHHNVIVDQEWDAILLGRGVVGNNWIRDNLIINAGLRNFAPSSGAAQVCYRIAMADPTGVSVPHDPNLAVITGNTALNCGASGGASSAAGVFLFEQISTTLNLFNNISYQQSVSFPYVTTGSRGTPGGTDATKYKTNLWYGAGPAPAFDSSPVSANPLFVSASGTLDLHLQAGSPARAAGIVLTSPSLDFDGVSRPSSGTWDIGAYQSAANVAGSGVPSGGSGIAQTSGTVTAVAPAKLTLAYNGKLRDAVGQGKTAIGADGALDGTLTVTLSAPGGRTVTGLRLDSNAPGTWDTRGSGFWVLAVAPTLAGAVLNASGTMAVNFPVADGGSFVVFASDYLSGEFLPGRTLTLTATFADGSTATAVTTVAPAASNANLTLTYNGMLRDRVGQGNRALVPDGAPDGTLTVTLSAPGARTVTGLRLDSNAPGTWDTHGSGFWVLAVAPTLDGALLNASGTMAVNFPVADGGSFVVFASDYLSGEFLPGRMLTLTATFSDGSTATAMTTVPVTSTSSTTTIATPATPITTITMPASPAVVTTSSSAPTTAPGTWAALPGTALAPVIWKDAQGRSVNELKGGNAWYTMLNMWNGAGYRYDTDTMVFPALGGHQDGADNSVYSVNIRTPSASRDFDATVDIIPNIWEIPAKAFPRYVDTKGEYGPAGLSYPSAAHRYDGMVHIEGTDYIWVGGGPAWGSNTYTSDIFLWDTKNKRWTWMDQDPLLAYESTIAATYDSVGKRVLYIDSLGIVEWVLSRPAGQRARRVLTFPQGQDTSNRFKTLLVDVKRNRLVAAGVTNATTGASQILYWDLTTLQPGVLNASTAAFPAWSLVSPGFDIDVDNDRYLIYSGGNTLRWVNPATGSITLEQTTGAPAVIDTNGTWGRMRYSRNLKTVIFTQDVFAGTWVYQVRQP